MRSVWRRAFSNWVENVGHLMLPPFLPTPPRLPLHPTPPKSGMCKHSRSISPENIRRQRGKRERVRKMEKLFPLLGPLAFPSSSSSSSSLTDGSRVHPDRLSPGAYDAQSHPTSVFQKKQQPDLLLLGKGVRLYRAMHCYSSSPLHLPSTHSSRFSRHTISQDLSFFSLSLTPW